MSSEGGEKEESNDLRGSDSGSSDSESTSDDVDEEIGDLEEVIRDIFNNDDIGVQSASSASEQVDKLFQRHKSSMDIFVQKVQKKNWSISKIRVLIERIQKISQKYSSNMLIQKLLEYVVVEIQKIYSDTFVSFSSVKYTQIAQ